MPTERRVWDLPTRLFHWSLVPAIVAAVISGQIGGNLIDLHGKIGIFLAGLVAFRIAWGLVGSTYARFATFFPTPARLRAYLRGEWRALGHNPLGALSVFAMLGLIAAQIACGLFANDDIAFKGPLADLVAKELSDRLTGVHKLLVNGLIALVILHLAAIAFYAHVRKDNLVRPMITGRKLSDTGEPARGGGPAALAVALAIGIAAAWAASGAWLPPPPPPVAAPAAAPAW